MSLFPGDPALTTPMEFKGAGTAATTALNSFKTTIGGTDNTLLPTPQTGGFRNINWDGVALDGTDFGGPPNTTVINLNQTVAIPLNRFQTRGVRFGDVYAVSGDGFTDVNPNVERLFPAFTPTKTFAMFNDNKIDMSFVLASAATTTPVPAATRGFGAIFINVQQPGSTIEYFSGERSLGTFNVPVSATAGAPEFLGEVFPTAIVTRVTLTLGNDVLFTFNGQPGTATGTSVNDATHNLVVTDDFEYAEPVPLNGAPPALSGAQGTLNATTLVNAKVGTPFTGTVATFSDTDAGTGPQSYTAVINWGDGHTTNGRVVSDGLGGFNVMGTNNFSVAGRVPMSIDVEKFDTTGNGASLSLTNTALVTAAETTTTLTASPTTSIVGDLVFLSVTVAPAQGSTGTPTGQVTFKDGDTVLGNGTLTAASSGGGATATLTTNKLTVGTHNLTAVYNTDGNFNGSTSNTVTETVRTDVTNQVRFALGKVTRRGNKFRQHVDITNIGGNLNGPLAFVLGGLPGKVKLVNATGLARVQTPGSPFIVLNLGSSNQLATNQTNGVDLTFTARNKGSIRYTPRVFAGPGPV